MSAVRGLFLELLLLAWTTSSIPLTKQCLLFELYLSGHWCWHEGFRLEDSLFQNGLHCCKINRSFCFLFSTIPVDKLLSERSKRSSLPIAYQRKVMWVSNTFYKTYDTCLPGDYTSFADGTCCSDFSICWYISKILFHHQKGFLLITEDYLMAEW